ncbi:gas vesicle protein, partial [Synechococcus sp. H60.3]
MPTSALCVPTCCCPGPASATRKEPRCSTICWINCPADICLYAFANFGGEFPVPITSQPLATATHGSSLADVLERVLDKGIVIAGDITVSVGNVELLNVRIRLLISSVDKA